MMVDEISLQAFVDKSNAQTSLNLSEPSPPKTYIVFS